MRKMLFSAAIAITFMAQAQQFEVTEMAQVPTDGHEMTYHPRFMPNGDLLVTALNYNGLAVINATTGEYTKLTEMQGAGYYPVISPDGKTILTRSMDKVFLTQDIYVIDVATKKLTSVARGINHVNQLAFNGSYAMMPIEGKAVTKKVGTSATSGSLDDLLITSEDLKIVMYANGVRTVLDPLAGKLDWDPHYINASLSPDKSRILFGCADNAYVCNLDGSNVVKLGALRSPQWRGNTHVVGMQNEDDGYYYTKSEIVIVDVAGNNLQQLTTSSDEIKMFPSVSNDGSKIAFHTIDGKIYVMTIKEK